MWALRVRPEHLSPLSTVNQMLLRLIIFVLVVSAGAALDQWSKHWASRSLATFDHPLPLRVDGAHDGKSVDALLSLKFPELDAPRRQYLRLNHVRLLAHKRLDVNDAVPTRNHLFVFHRKRLDQAPRRIYYTRLPMLTLVFNGWLGVDLRQTNAELRRLARAETVSKVFHELIPCLAKVDLGNVAGAFTYTLKPTVLGKDRKLRKGQLLLLTSRRITVVKNFFRFNYAENPGAAWDFMAGASPRFRLLLFGTVTIIALFVILLLYVRVTAAHRFASWGLLLVGAGAVGNLVDRLRFNYVVDFIQWHWYAKAYWPTFNVADILIVLGVGMLIGDMLFNRNSVLLRRGTE